MAPRYTKRIVCLANSRKTSGRCIAGKVVPNPASNEWVRPVSARPSRELSEEERRYEDGNDPKLLDVILVPMDRPSPHGSQTENHLIDDNYHWAKESVLSADQLSSLLDKVVGPLWNNESGSSGYGINDRVLEQTAAELGCVLINSAAESRRTYVRLSPNNGAKADIVGLPRRVDAWPRPASMSGISSTGKAYDPASRN